ncbi:MAG: hypothetical protein KC736_05090, partial [Candidatus Moranbacteria bacterium]|nr:hypothetical protein [Candidatus Moranbacteria bacterium]
MFLSLFSFSAWALSPAQYILEKVENQSPSVWDFSDSSENFIPHRVGIKVCKAEKKIITGFYLSQDNLDFYRQKFSDGKRKPMGFEFDIHDLSGVFSRSDLEDVYLHLPHSVWYPDNHSEDEDNLYTVAINDPSKLEKGKWYLVELRFSKHVDVSSATFQVYIQLVGNLRELYYSHHQKWDEYSPAVNTAFIGYFANANVADGNDYFNILTVKDQFTEGDFFQKGDRRLWDYGSGKPKFDFAPYACSFGPDPYESGGSNDGNTPLITSNPDTRDGT